MRLLAFFIVLPTLSLAASCSLFTSGVDDPVVDPIIFISDGTPCGDACANRLNCAGDDFEAAETMRLCVESCGRVADDTLTSCLAGATCDALGECDGPGPVSNCGAACSVLAGCDLEDDLTEGTCSCWQYSNEAMGCIAQAGCDGIEDCLDNSPREGACRAAATKLSGCGELNEVATKSWVSFCAVDGAEGLTDCIAQYPCEVVIPRCLPPLIAPNCFGTCRRLNSCSALGEQSRAQCQATCEEADWAESYRRCVAQNTCSELSANCPETGR